MTDTRTCDAPIYVDPNLVLKHSATGEPTSEYPDRLTQYDHLNEGGIPLNIDMDDLAKQIVAMNYGFVRMCAALCRAARKHQRSRQARLISQGNGDVKATSPLSDVIEKAIMQGLAY